MHQFKAIFSDIDGTLLNSQHQISAKTVQSIQRVLQQGVPFILASARAPLAMTDFYQQLNARCPMICYGGALILDADLQPLYSVELAQVDFEKVSHILEQVPDLSLNYYSGLEWFCPNPENKWTQQESQITKIVARPKPKHLTHVHKILVIAEAKLILITEKVLKALFPHLAIHRSKNEYLEIMHPDASKANAMRFLQQKLGLTQQEILAFGDNFNDLDMLFSAGLGVAMGNAPEQIKQAVDRVALDNDSDGLALVLDELF